METGYRGAWVISWHQAEIDGVTGAPLAALDIGSCWRWSGEAVRVDGPNDILCLDEAVGAAEVRRRAAEGVRRLVGAALGREAAAVRPPSIPDESTTPDGGFVVTDGRERYDITVIDVAPGAPRLLLFTGRMPAAGAEHWVISRQLEASRPPVGAAPPSGVICFTPGTSIRTAEGARPVEALAPGDRVQTRDSGPCEILWIGRRRISGARLHAMPHLRPIRFRAGALGMDEPEADLVVSPQHRVLLRGRVAAALFNTDEVLVAAEDLVNDRSVVRDHTVRETTYIHLLFERHEVLWANGVATESFHPAGAAFEAIDPGQRAELLMLFPGLDLDPHGYGSYCRRPLTTSEAALMRAERMRRL